MTYVSSALRLLHCTHVTLHCTIRFIALHNAFTLDSWSRHTCHVYDYTMTRMSRARLHYGTTVMVHDYTMTRVSYCNIMLYA